MEQSDLRPNIYEYLNYRLFLKDLIHFQKNKRNASFSYRNFARQAGIRSWNFLKLVTDGKRNLSQEAIYKFAKAFKLNRGEVDFFCDLVLFNQAKSIEEKKHYYERLSKNKKHSHAKPLEAKQYAYFSTWHLVALRELVTLKGFKEQAQWINKKLGIKFTTQQLRQAINLLIDLKLLTRDAKGRLQQTIQKISTSPETNALAVINFHRQMLKKASESLESSQQQHRDISALTLSVSKRQYEWIRERINQVRREIHAWEEEDSKEAVYQINFQVFNLSEVPWN